MTIIDIDVENLIQIINNGAANLNGIDNQLREYAEDHKISAYDQIFDSIKDFRKIASRLEGASKMLENMSK
jgi:GMP synthase-like glutamine amidotransferase